MRKVALLVLPLALLGIASLFMAGPTGSLWNMYSEFDPWRPGVAILGFGLAAVAAILSLRGAHAQTWQSFAVLGGFVVVLAKFRAWRILTAFDNATLPAKLLAIAIFGGVICGLFAVFLPNHDETSSSS